MPATAINSGYEFQVLSLKITKVSLSLCNDICIMPNMNI